ncbi:MAG: NAD(P)H-hydrate dehydratase [Planctomycetota bacterium]|nr:NAD(P)H-hydrate dehydratase [Planctomycetota bacterium]
MSEAIQLPPRDPRGHKGTFGTVVVVGGCAHSPRMIGAPALAARGAVRAGAGLVRVLSPAPIVDAVLGLCPWATGWALPTDASGQLVPHEATRCIDEQQPDRLGVLRGPPRVCLAIGPGLGRGGGVDAAVMRAITQDWSPVVVDADALNALADMPEFWRDLRAPAVLTPHPGEFRRLARAMGLDANELADVAARERAAREMASRLGCVVVLKGAGTVVCDALNTWTCTRGNPCMATGGTGDVLTGVIAALVAQHTAFGGVGGALVAGVTPLPANIAERLRRFAPEKLTPPSAALSLFQVACAGVEAHARAGERWAATKGCDAGMLPSELADEVPAAIASLR